MSYIEDCLYSYKDNLNLVEKLKNDLDIMTSLKSLNLRDISGSADYNSDPVANTVFKKMVIERRILRLEKKIIPVSKLYEDLTNSTLHYINRLREVLEHRYFNYRTWGEIARALCISRFSVWNYNRELLKYSRKFFND